MHTTTNSAIRMVDLIEAINAFLPSHVAWVVTDDSGRVIPFPAGVCLHCAEGEFDWQAPHLFWRLFFDLIKSHGVDVEGAQEELRNSIEGKDSHDHSPYDGMKILRIIAQHMQ